jgi:capsular exopolysaccharide synthesis family protein
MVIERALEKLKQANAGSPAAAPKTERPLARRASDAQPEIRAAARAPINPSAPRPSYIRLECDRSQAIQHRILLPGTPLAADGRVLAAYRILRTRLLNLISLRNWTVLAVTSPGAGEGKSVTACNLALNFAREGSRSVYLIDLDMRHPTICRYLGAQPPHTVINYFSGECDAHSVFFSIGAENLAIAGNLVNSDLASEMLASDRLEQLFGYIKSVAPNPLIIVDLPPTLVTDEALMIAPRVDATVLVVADGLTRRDSLVRARELLAEYPLAGVILNKSTESVGSSGEYYGYAYGAKT